jgi:hypothetical protein
MPIEITVDFIGEKGQRREFLVTFHAHQERQAEGIRIAEIREALSHAEILESYPDDPRGVSCLVLGFAGRRPLHIVCGQTTSEKLVIITVYSPRKPKWIDPHTRGRREE